MRDVTAKLTQMAMGNATGYEALLSALDDVDLLSDEFTAFVDDIDKIKGNADWISG